MNHKKVPWRRLSKELAKNNQNLESYLIRKTSNIEKLPITSPTSNFQELFLIYFEFKVKLIWNKNCFLEEIYLKKPIRGESQMQINTWMLDDFSHLKCPRQSFWLFWLLQSKCRALYGCTELISFLFTINRLSAFILKSYFCASVTLTLLLSEILYRCTFLLCFQLYLANTDCVHNCNRRN